MKLDKIKVMTPNGEMLFDATSYLALIDSSGAPWSFLVNDLELVTDDTLSGSSDLSGRLMTINEDYIKTLKGLAEINNDK